MDAYGVGNAKKGIDKEKNSFECFSGGLKGIIEEFTHTTVLPSVLYQ